MLNVSRTVFIRSDIVILTFDFTFLQYNWEQVFHIATLFGTRSLVIIACRTTDLTLLLSVSQTSRNAVKATSPSSQSMRPHLPTSKPESTSPHDTTSSSPSNQRDTTSLGGPLQKVPSFSGRITSATSPSLSLSVLTGKILEEP